MGYQVGQDFKAYYDATGVDTPTWIEMSDVEDVTEENGKAVGTVKNRASAYEKALGGQRTMSGTLKQTYDKASTAQLALLAAYEGDSVFGLAIADGDIATPGTIALQLDALITSHNRSQGVDDVSSLENAFVPHANGSASFPDIVIVS